MDEKEGIFLREFCGSKIETHFQSEKAVLSRHQMPVWVEVNLWIKEDS
jgi:hypothetical protein